MSQVLHLPDELYRILADYAAKHQETPEEALAALVRALPDATAPTTAPAEGDAASTGAQEPCEDPWEGFYGRFTADVPDITINHDKYLAESYLDPHDDE